MKNPNQVWKSSCSKFCACKNFIYTGKIHYCLCWSYFINHFWHLKYLVYHVRFGSCFASTLLCILARCLRDRLSDGRLGVLFCWNRFCVIYTTLAFSWYPHSLIFYFVIITYITSKTIRWINLGSLTLSIVMPETKLIFDLSRLWKILLPAWLSL